MIQIGIVMYLTIKFHKSIYVTLPPNSVSSKSFKLEISVLSGAIFEVRDLIFDVKGQNDWIYRSCTDVSSIFTPQGRKPNFVAPQVTNGYITLKTELHNVKKIYTTPRTLAFMEQMLFI